jgi:hypothetical protein
MGRSVVWDRGFVQEQENVMTRKASGVPKEKPPTPLIIAEHLPTAPADLYNHVNAGWTAMKADAAHFPSPPATGEMDTAVTNLGLALKAGPNGAPTDTAAVTAAATAVRELWGLNSRYAQKMLRALPVEQVPPILANVLLYASQKGKRGPKPPIQAKRATTSGSAVVILLAVAQALTYMYEWSLDQVTWQSMTSGHTRVTIAGLLPGKLYWFRARAFLRNETTTDPVGLIDLIVG